MDPDRALFLVSNASIYFRAPGPQDRAYGMRTLSHEFAKRLCDPASSRGPLRPLVLGARRHHPDRERLANQQSGATVWLQVSALADDRVWERRRSRARAQRH